MWLGRGYERLNCSIDFSYTPPSPSDSTPSTHSSENTQQNPTNRILAHVRPGGNRSLSHFNNLCARITESWERIVVGNEKEEKNERELRAVFVLGTIVAGWEVGFSLPAVRILRLSIFFLSFFISIRLTLLRSPLFRLFPITNSSITYLKSISR